MVCIEANKFCYCWSVQVGAYILGAFNFMNFFLNLHQSEWLKCAILIWPVLAFTWLLLNDSRMSRGVYFIAFLFHQIVHISIQAYEVFYKGLDVKTQIQILNGCQQIELDYGGFEGGDQNFKDLEDCCVQTRKDLETLNWLALIIGGLLGIHFLQVLCKHFRNADRPESLGGCQKNNNELSNNTNGAIEINHINSSVDATTTAAEA